MKVNLQKKRAVAAAMLLTMCCYGQAWAENFIDKTITIAAGQTETIGTADEWLTIKNSNITLGDGATVKIEGKTINFYGNTTIEGKGAVDINTGSKFGASGSINASLVHIKSVDTIYLKDVSINDKSEYKNAVTQIEGNIETSNWTFDDDIITKINFNGKDSFFKGVTWIEGYNSGSTEFTFDKGAQWIVSTNGFGNGNRLTNLNLLDGSVLDFDSTVSMIGDHRYLIGLYIWGNFNADGGIIKSNFDGSINYYEALYNPDGSFWASGFFVGTNSISCGEHYGDTTIILKNHSDDNTYILGRPVIVVGEEHGTFKGGKEEGALSWTNYTLKSKLGSEYASEFGYEIDDHDKNSTYWYIDSFSHETAPTTSTKTLLSTITAGYDTWRNDTDKFNERMGELRMNGAGNEGVWVRTKGSEFGRHSSNGSYTNKQQTYQLGYDTVTSKDEKQTTYTGVAAEYGKGNLTFDSGTGTMKSLGLGVYQSQLRESGHYLDLTYRFDKYKNDFHVADSMGNPISGKYGNNAMSLSAEYGRKNALKHSWYVEPQSEVTLGYMFGNDFTTSNTIRVEQKNMPALIGRLGLNIGREVSDKVNFYVKASVNHDFLGNYDMHMTDMSTGERLNASDKFGSSWFDYGAGLSVKTGKDSYAYFDIERAVGGEYKKNWDWNAGVRWSF